MKQLFQCPVCGLHYYDKELTQNCEAFCKEFNACSMEITQHSVEQQEFLKGQKS